MAILGLEPGGLIIVLQGLSTYTALGSAWFFAKPVLRGQPVAASKTILSEVKSSQQDVAALFAHATEALSRRESDNRPLDKRDNKRGLALLVLSLLLFTAALVLQIQTEPSFHPKAPVKTSGLFPSLAFAQSLYRTVR